MRHPSHALAVPLALCAAAAGAQPPALARAAATDSTARAVVRDTVVRDTVVRDTVVRDTVVRGTVAARRPLLLTAGGLAVATAAVMPFDARLEAVVRAPGPQGSAALRHAARVANLAGDPGALVASIVLFGAGRLADRPHVAALGLHTGAAIVLGGTATAVLKVALGRQRPNVERGDADDFAPTQGRRAARASLPSGHTTAAFAFASAAAADLRAWHPAAARVATPLLYAAAAAVGAARMYDDKHWASDVVLGAGIGTLAGTRVVAYARAHPNNRVERLAGALTLAPAPYGRGVMMGLHRDVR